MIRPKSKQKVKKLFSDTAHGEAVRAIVVAQRVHTARVEAQAVGVGLRVRRRRPVVAAAANVRQGARRATAIAGRCKEVALCITVETLEYPSGCKVSDDVECCCIL